MQDRELGLARIGMRLAAVCPVSDTPVFARHLRRGSLEQQ